MSETGEACTSKVCYKCGVKGFHEGLLTCSTCKIIREHRYCTVNYPVVSEPWVCETCEENKQMMQLPSKSTPFNKTKESAKVKFISAEEVASLASGSKAPISSSKGCLGASVPRTGDTLKKPSLPSKSMYPRPIAKPELQGYSEKTTSHVTAPAGFQSLRVDDEASHTPSKPQSKNVLAIKSEDVLPTLQPISTAIKSQLARSESRCSLQVSSPDTNNDHLIPPDKALACCKEETVEGCSYVDIQWRGHFVINDMGVHIYEDIRAHFPGKISTKGYNASKALPEKLQFRLISRLDVWPKIFQWDPPTCDDVALYFVPSEFGRPKEKYIRLLERMDKLDLAMHCHLNNLELLIYTSKLLPLHPQKLNTKPYLWGTFRHLRRKKRNQETRVPGEGSDVEADMLIDMVGGNDVGPVDGPVAKPPVMQKGQLNDWGSASDQSELNINKSSTDLPKLENNHKERNIPSVPPGFSKPRNEDSGCEKKPLVKFSLRKPISHIISDIPLPFYGPHNLKHETGSSESAGKSPTPQKYDKGHPLSSATRGGHVISHSNTDKVDSRYHQVPLIDTGSSDRKVIRQGKHLDKGGSM